MALYDNKYWLLSHIRNSFITTDDTGMCELVMAGESKEVKKHVTVNETYPEPVDSDDDEDDLDPDSYDIIPMDFEFGIRERSNTAARLEKMDQAKRKLAKVKHIKWEDNKEPLSQEYIDEMFVRQDISAIKVNTKRSLLTEAIRNSINLPANPYTEFARFDGSGQVNIPTKQYRIFLTMLPEDQRNYPTNISCIATAKIEELIGLILLKSSTHYGDLVTKTVNNYGLYITEEDGEVDRDFPCLDPKEPVGKFGFTCLGLVEHKESTKNVTFDDIETITISSSIDFIKRKTERDSELEKKRQFKNNMELIAVHKKAMEAPLYQSYKVFKVINKVRAKIEIHLGISGDKIEIDPIQQNNGKFVFFKQKPISHPMDTIACCEITDVKSNSTSFRIVYSSSLGGNPSEFHINASSFSPSLQTSASFKHYDFEADNSTALEIEQKINLILDLRSSASRKEYLASRERKQYKRKSFNLGKK